MKAVVSVLGKDKKGIIAKVSTALCNDGINILDISQTILQKKYFTMIMIVELPEKADMDSINYNLQSQARELGVEIRIQHEDIFNSMHRI